MYKKQILNKEAGQQTLSAQVVNQDQMIKIITAQLGQAKNDLEQMQAEILKNVLSMSWQVTQPLRKVRRKMEWLFGERYRLNRWRSYLVIKKSGYFETAYYLLSQIRDVDKWSIN